MRSFDPRPDQLETITAITTALAHDGTRATAVLPCGYGKTFVAQQAAEQLTAQMPDPLILVAVPNLVLVEQMIGDWTDNASAGYAFTALPVNSRSGRKTEDEITGITIEGVTADPDEIARFLTGTGRRVVFSTYQSMDTIAAAIRKVTAWRPDFAFDVAISDEAHRTAGPVRGAEPSVYKTILDNDKIPSHRRAFFTATPRVASKKKGSDEHPYSMDNEASYGQTVANKSLTWAQQQGLLVEHDVFVVSVDDDGLHRLLEANPLIRVDGSAEEARMVAAAIALAKTARQRHLGGVITYHSSIANAQAFQRILTAVVDTLPDSEKPTGTLHTGHVNGLMKGGERAGQIALLDASNRGDDDWAVVTNCTCLAEGVNVPSMDAVAIIDPRKSLVDITQSVGRPVRRDPNRPNKRATVLIPAYVGAAQTAKQAVEEGRYEAVFQVIRALADSDEGLAEAFRIALRQPSADPSPTESRERGAVSFVGEATGWGDPSEIGRISIVPPHSWAGEEWHTSAGEWGQWHESLRTELLESIAPRRVPRTREEYLNALQGFFAQHGRDPKQGDSFGSVPVGNWYHSQRGRHSKGLLPTDLEQSMLAIIPHAFEPKVEASRRRHLAALKSFVAEFGRAPTKEEEYQGLKLGSWFHSKRMAFKQGSLIQDLAEDIRAILPDAMEPMREAYDVHHERLLSTYAKFISLHQRTPSLSEEFEGLKLGRWFAHRREGFRRGTISPALHDRIVEIFPSSFESKSTWAVHVAVLKSFVKAHGRHPLQLECHEGVKIGKWVAYLRARLRKGKLTSAQISEVLSIAPLAFEGIELNLLRSAEAA